jgi:sporulation integral membrane protein YtvI
MKEPKIYIKILLNFIITILTVLFLLFILPGILRFFMPFVIGWVIAMIANPLVKFLENKVKLLRKHSSAIIIITVILAVAGVLYLTISFLAREILELMNDLPSIVDEFEDRLNGMNDQLHGLSGSLTVNMQTQIDNILAASGDFIRKFVADFKVPTMSAAGSFAKNIAEGFLMTIVTILSAYFFIVEREKLLAILKKQLPESTIRGWGLISDNFKAAFGGYFKAQFKIMIVLIIIMFVGFEILKVDYSFLIALGIAFLDLLPVFGTGAVLWPWAVIDIIMGNYASAVGLVVIYLICQVLKQILQPKIVGDSIGISPLTTLIFMFVGYKFYGVIGMIIGIPIGMVLVNLYRIGIFESTICGFRIIFHDINEFRKY